MGKGKPNMRDVAQAANVSLSAVWMVIHNKPGIAPETADKVWASIDRLGYTMKTNSKEQPGNSIGLLIEKGSIPAMMDSFYGEVLHGFQAEAQRSGYQVMLMMFDRTTDNLELLRMD